VQAKRPYLATFRGSPDAQIPRGGRGERERVDYTQDEGVGIFLGGRIMMRLRER
jgi:hypothetical protein